MHSEPMPTQSEHLERCLNCNSLLDGEFCSQCGQAKSARLVPLKTWMSDLFGSFIDLDSRLLRTLVQLFFYPGQATLDFAEGHRVSYTGPARIYIFVSAISIAAMTLAGAFERTNEMFYLGTEVSEEFQKRVQFLFPFVNLLSPFLTAGLLALFQRAQFFQLHLAFSLHFWAFQIGVTTPLIFLAPTSIWMLLSFAAVSIIVTCYLYIAHRRVYSLSLPRRLFMCLVVLCSIPLASFLFVALLFVLSSSIS